MQDARRKLAELGRPPRVVALWICGTPGGLDLTQADFCTPHSVRSDDAHGSRHREFWKQLGLLVETGGDLLLLRTGEAADWSDCSEILNCIRSVLSPLGRNLRLSACGSAALGSHAADFEGFFDDAATTLRDWGSACEISQGAVTARLQNSESILQMATQNLNELKQAELDAIAAQSVARTRLVQVEADLQERFELLELQEKMHLFDPDKAETFGDVSTHLRAGGIIRGAVQLIVGIDFTYSNMWNGIKMFGGRSLHDTTAGVPTPYEFIIEAISSGLQPFDDDLHSIFAYGFGDARTRADKVFAMYDEEPPQNVGILRENYRHIAANVKMAGPTSFAPIVNKAIELVQARRGTPEFAQLHVLLIITDGEVTRDAKTPDMEYSQEEFATLDAVIQASHLPLSIVLVGVGDGLGDPDAGNELMQEGDAWSAARQIVSAIPGRAFDNFTFVEYNSLATSMERFAAHALVEIPEQWRQMQELGILQSDGPHASLFESRPDGSPRPSPRRNFTLPPPVRLGLRAQREGSPGKSSRLDGSNSTYIREEKAIFSAVLAGSVLGWISHADFQTIVAERTQEPFNSSHFSRFCGLKQITTEKLRLENFHDYCAYLRSRGISTAGWAETVFHLYDVAGSGLLDRTELAQVNLF